MSLAPFFYGINIQCGLDIYFLITHVDNKVYFILAQLAFAIYHSLNFYHSYCNFYWNSNFLQCK